MFYLSENLKKYRILKNLTQEDAAVSLASTLPHMRECREVIMPFVCGDTGDEEIDRNIRLILMGE